MTTRASPMKKHANFLSPLEGEMAAKQPEGVTSEGTATMPRTAATTPPGRFAATLPSGGRESSRLGAYLPRTIFNARS